MFSLGASARWGLNGSWRQSSRGLMGGDVCTARLRLGSDAAKDALGPRPNRPATLRVLVTAEAAPPHVYISVVQTVPDTDLNLN